VSRGSIRRRRVVGSDVARLMADPPQDSEWPDRNQEARRGSSQSVNEVADGGAKQNTEQEDSAEQTVFQGNGYEFLKTYEAVSGILGSRLPVLGIG
jgi:hypothetical protein